MANILLKYQNDYANDRCVQLSKNSPTSVYPSVHPINNKLILQNSSKTNWIC